MLMTETPLERDPENLLMISSENQAGSTPKLRPTNRRWRVIAAVLTAVALLSIAGTALWGNRHTTPRRLGWTDEHQWLEVAGLGIAEFMNGTYERDDKAPEHKHLTEGIFYKQIEPENGCCIVKDGPENVWYIIYEFGTSFSERWYQCDKLPESHGVPVRGWKRVQDGRYAHARELSVTEIGNPEIKPVTAVEVAGLAAGVNGIFERDENAEIKKGCKRWYRYKHDDGSHVCRTRRGGNDFWSIALMKFPKHCLVCNKDGQRLFGDGVGCRDSPTCLNGYVPEVSARYQCLALLNSNVPPMSGWEMREKDGKHIRRGTPARDASGVLVKQVTE